MHASMYVCMRLQLRTVLLEISKPQQTLAVTQILHAFIIKSRLLNDPFYGTKLIRLYGINKDLNAARQLFNRASQQSVYLWNSIIRAYAKAHHLSDAVTLFKLMLCSDCRPDNFTFACVLRVFSECFCPEGIRIVHAEVVSLGLGSDPVCSSALVKAYSKVGHAEEAASVFAGIMEPDLVLWNSMISGFGGFHNWDKGLELFKRMRNAGKLSPDGYTMVALISSLADPVDITIGQIIHGLCLKCGLDSNYHVSSSLVSMYSRYKCMDSASNVFCSLLLPDLVTWSALVTGFSEAGQYEMALEVFRKMNFMGIKADTILLASTLAASGHLAIIGPGQEIHGYVLRHGFDMEIMVSSALVDMYAKCGFLRLVIRVFDQMPKKNVVSYNSFISSLGLYGLPSDAFKRFEQLLHEGIRPDTTTFSSLLSACCHAGLVKEGRDYFRRMISEFQLLPETEHFVHMVKLLGMAGELLEAYELIKRVPEQVDISIWGALLSCCEVHRNAEVAEIVACKIREYDEPLYKVMLANVYARDERWEDVEVLRVDNLESGKRKLPGISWIGDVKSIAQISSGKGLFNLHQFCTGQLKHVQAGKSCWSMHGNLKLKTFPNRQHIHCALSDGPVFESDISIDAPEPELPDLVDEDVSSLHDLYTQTGESGGKPGLISFYNRPFRIEDEILVSTPGRNERNLLWLVGPAVLVASFIFPSLYLRKILSSVFEDSLLTDFLILFFTEAIFYGGVAIFILLIHHLRRPIEQLYSAKTKSINPQLGHRISSVTVLVLSLIIPMVTMGFVWPWTGPAASATLAPYLVGIVVQFAFEQYARYTKSPSWPAIPIIFQVYRLHQLNRAAQLVTALSFTIKGAEMTSHNMAISSSLGTLLNVLQFLGVICIWSLSSFIMRLLPTATVAGE